MTWQAEAIYSVLNNTNVVGSTTADGRPIRLNSFEQEADRGSFRGALDAAGLLNAYLSG